MLDCKGCEVSVGDEAFEIKLWGPLAAVQAADVRASIGFVSGVAAATPMRGGSATAAVNGTSSCARSRSNSSRCA